MKINYDLKNIRSWLGDSYYIRGIDYQRKGLVESVEFDGEKILGSVIGGKRYKQIISLANNKISGQCTCPIGYNCKHVAAVLIEALVLYEKEQVLLPTIDAQFEDELSYNTKEWIEKLALFEQSKQPKKKQLLYLIAINPYDNLLKVRTVLMDLKKDGSWSGKYKDFNASTVRQNPHYLSEEDKVILQDFLHYMPQYYTSHDRTLKDKKGQQLLQQMVQTNRCYFEDLNKEPIKYGANREGKISWQLSHDGSQKSVIICQEAIDGFFILEDLHYVDAKNNCLGLIKMDLEPKLASLIMSCPAIKENESTLVRNIIEQHIKPDTASDIALPYIAKNTVIKKATPNTCLRLYNIEIYTGHTKKMLIPALDLYFEYHGQKVSCESHSSVLTIKDNDQLLKIPRDLKYERKAMDMLEEMAFCTTDDLSHGNIFYKNPKEEGSLHPYIFLDFRDVRAAYNPDIIDQWLDFLNEDIPKLKKKKWHIDIADDFLIELITPDEEWYSNINSTNVNGWFDMDIGIYIAGQKVSLIPILIRLLRMNQDIFTEIQDRDDEDHFLVEMQQGKILQLPVARIKNIILFLQNFLDADFDENGLKISRFSANIVAELAASEKATKLRFLDDHKLIEIGEKLSDFKKIQRVKMPKNFTLELRHYQQDGLDWLQFLREYNFAGILADDMGLGKTIQTLAHIQCEKENKRLDKPVLIVAPTSVVGNWQEEIKRITPTLNFTVLHGANRKEELPDDISKSDIIVTSYALLRIDKDLLLGIDYHSVILDEAQYIKNSKAKVTLIANQIKAQHRLCLTGTPIENHLGELWSMFNFLMPGFLGSEKNFNQLFRHPIEKQHHHGQKAVLAKRIKPFLLRRTKEKILHELPQKTEIVRHIELSSKQRDLYETIRSITFKEVKDEIEKKGFARSQIKILEALLRLRQICCDPRISNLKNIKKADSAKMDYLMEMLPDLIEQGRSILLFSQFTSMLKLIEEECNAKKIPYVKITGNTKDRKTPIQQFQAGKVPLFLISLKAGGVGLNLTKADTVIHYDPWWNPAVENQATDRAHRIGQQNPVFVYKLITMDTVEEKILHLQNQKKDLADKIFDPNNANNNKITISDLQEIFQSSLV